MPPLRLVPAPHLQHSISSHLLLGAACKRLDGVRDPSNGRVRLTCGASLDQAAGRCACRGHAAGSTAEERERERQETMKVDVVKKERTTSLIITLLACLLCCCCGGGASTLEGSRASRRGRQHSTRRLETYRLVDEQRGITLLHVQLNHLVSRGFYEINRKLKAGCASSFVVQKNISQCLLRLLLLPPPSLLGRRWPPRWGNAMLLFKRRRMLSRALKAALKWSARSVHLPLHPREMQFSFISFLFSFPFLSSRVLLPCFVFFPSRHM